MVILKRVLYICFVLLVLFFGGVKSFDNYFTKFEKVELINFKICSYENIDITKCKSKVVVNELYIYEFSELINIYDFDCSKILGYEIKINKSDCARKFLGNYKLAFSEKIAGNISKYYYANKSDYFVYINNKKIGMQIVEKSEEIIIGFPVIITSY